MQVKHSVFVQYIVLIGRRAWRSTTTSVLLAIFGKVDRVKCVFQIQHTVNATGVSTYFVLDIFYFRITEFYVWQF